MATNNAKKQIITYLVIVFAISSIFYVLISQNGGVESDAASGFVLFLMWSPGVAALITTFIYQRNLRGMGWGLGKPKYYAIAYFLPKTDVLGIRGYLPFPEPKVTEEQLREGEEADVPTRDPGNLTDYARPSGRDGE